MPISSRRDAGVRPAVAAAAIALLLCPGGAVAKDLSRSWYFGGNIGFHSTQDSVGSNAAETNDPRPDRFQNREIGVEDGLSWSVTAGYGMTRLLSLQLDVGYFRGDVGDVDVYLIDTFPVTAGPSNPTNIIGFRKRETTVPVTAGVLTEVPVTISAVLRFRPTATVNPWISAGVGKVFTEVTPDPDLFRLNARTDQMRVRGIVDELGVDLTGGRYTALQGEGRVPLRYPVSVEVNDAKEWHLAAGFDYFINDRLSLIADVRYVSIDKQVVIDLRGENQVVYSTFSEKLFRKDGSLRFFSSGGVLPNPLVDPNDVSRGRVMCAVNTSRDFDSDGHVDDLCFNYSSTNQPFGTFLVQGGAIDLGGFAFNIGLRIHLQP